VPGTPDKDPANRVGDCGDFQNASVRGAGWDIPYMTTGELAGAKGAEYYTSVSADAVQPGDTWVSGPNGGHTGIVQSTSSGYVFVLQNGGNPGVVMTHGDESYVHGYRNGNTGVARYPVTDNSVFLRPTGRKKVFP
jgi:hypothetical protein